MQDMYSECKTEEDLDEWKYIIINALKLFFIS